MKSMKITLCGSTRFMDQYNEWNIKLTMAGHLVYSVARPSTSFVQGEGPKEQTLEPIEKRHLDLIHLAKIEESDAIFVIDPNYYIGESTQREIAWANLRGKLVFYLSRPQYYGLLGCEKPPSNDKGEA